jgi:cytidylate kinase
MIVAIDGPAGSGKSTVAKLIAQRLDFLYLDTGAIYRALTLKVLEEGVDLKDRESIVNQAKVCQIEFKGTKVLLNGQDVTLKIRDPQIDKSISQVAQIPEVRAELVKVQRGIGGIRDCVVEGRDITTVVFPKAEVKIFLDADFSQRVIRRLGDFKKNNVEVNPDVVEDDLKERDQADMSRQVGPLKKAKDAVYLDTTNLSIEEVVEKVLELIKNKDKS